MRSDALLRVLRNTFVSTCPRPPPPVRSGADADTCKDGGVGWGKRGSEGGLRGGKKDVQPRHERDAPLTLGTHAADLLCFRRRRERRSSTP